MGNQANSQPIVEEEEEEKDFNFNHEFSLSVMFTGSAGPANNVEQVPKSQKYMIERTSEEFVAFINEMGVGVDQRVGHLVLMTSLRSLRVLLVYLWAAVITLLLVGHLLSLPTVYGIGYVCLVVYIVDTVVIVVKLQPKMIINYNEFVDQVDNNVKEWCDKYESRIGKGFKVTFTKKYNNEEGDCISRSMDGVTEEQDCCFALTLPCLMIWPLGMAAILCNNCAMKCQPSRMVSMVIHVDYRVQRAQELQVSAAQPIALVPIGQVGGVVPVGAVAAPSAPYNMAVNPVIATSTDAGASAPAAVAVASAPGQAPVSQGQAQPMVQMTQAQYQQMMATMAMMQQQFQVANGQAAPQVVAAPQQVPQQAVTQGEYQPQEGQANTYH